MPDGRFAIDQVTGEVTVAGALDREAAASYQIEVTATSTDGSTSTQTYTIALNDVDEFDVSPVTDADVSANTLAENAAAGTTVGVVASASDADATNSAVSYSVDDARFTVDADGTVRVADGAVFDHETEASIEITVTATSADGSTSSQAFTLAVSDVNEAAVSAISDRQQCQQRRRRERGDRDQRWNHGLCVGLRRHRFGELQPLRRCRWPLRH
jgi:large repetitive protein